MMRSMQTRGPTTSPALRVLLCASTVTEVPSADQSIFRNCTGARSEPSSSSRIPCSSVTSRTPTRGRFSRADARNGLFTYQGADGANHTVNLLTTSSRNLPINSFTKSLIDATPLPVAGGSVTVNPTAGDGLNIVGIRFNSPGTEMDKLYDLRIDHKLAGIDQVGHSLAGSRMALGARCHQPEYRRAVSRQVVATNCTGCGLRHRDRHGVPPATGRPRDQLDFWRIRVQRNPRRLQPPGLHLPAAEPPFNASSTYTFPGLPTNLRIRPRTRFRIRNTPTIPREGYRPFYSLADNFTKVKGAHTIKAGFLVSSTSTHRFNDFAGGAGVNGGVTPVVLLGVNANNNDGLSNCAGFPSLPAGTTGSSVCTRAQNIYASLVGLVNNISETYNAVPGQGYVQGLTDAFFIRERSYNFYGQDSWRVRPSLTVTGGVRWEVVPAPDMVNKRMLVPANGLNDVTPYGPLFQPSSTVTYNDLLANLPASTQLVAGGASNGNPFWKTQYNNLAPIHRRRLASQPQDRDSLRVLHQLRSRHPDDHQQRDHQQPWSAHRCRRHSFERRSHWRC